MRTNVYIKCYTVEARKDFFTRRYTINWTFETYQEIGKRSNERNALRGVGRRSQKGEDKRGPVETGGGTRLKGISVEDGRRVRQAQQVKSGCR